MNRFAPLWILFLSAVVEENHLTYSSDGNYTEAFNRTSIQQTSSSSSSSSSASTPSPSSPDPTTATTLSVTDSTTFPPVFHVSPVRNYNWVVALIVLASLGILTVLGLELYIQFKVCGSPLATDCSSQWLGHVLLVGILLSYALMFAYVPYPCPATCGIVRFCTGVCYAVLFGVVVVKLVVILSPAEIPTAVAAVLLLFVWLVQVAIDVQWLIRDPPGSVRRSSGGVDGVVCSPGFDEHVKTLVYVMALVVCSLCACALARGGKNSGDVVCIGVSCALTVAVWIAWILLGYLGNSVDFHDPCMAFGLLVTATVLLVFVIVPKVRQLGRIEEFALEAAADDDDDDVTKREMTIRNKKAAYIVNGSIVSGSNRSKGSIDDVSWSGGSNLEKGNRRGWNARRMETLVEDEDSLPPDIDPFALHLQYPVDGADPHSTRWGSVQSADGYGPRAKRPPSASSRTSEPGPTSAVNHRNHVRPTGVTHSTVNHHPKPEYYSYVVSSSVRRNRMPAANRSHNPRPKQHSRY